MTVTKTQPEIEPTASEHIAIVGMSLKVPGASTVEQFWKNTASGIESVKRFRDDELAAAGVAPELLCHPRYVKAAGVIDHVDAFDFDFFGYSFSEASRIDPQQRIFLQCAYHAMESAGWAPRVFPGAVGVFAGCAMSAYLLNNLKGELLSNEPAAYYQLLTGNDKDFLATRVSYKLGLRGPSVTVQTACSTSLSAVHLACQSLLAGECDMALAGGVSLRLPGSGYVYQEGMILSPDGVCRPFDANANGTVPGSGAAVVVLRRLQDALDQNEPICAIIRGSAMNNDGDEKVGFTAPSVTRQSAVIAEALAVAGVEPEAVGYVEAHGTGTTLGDPIEIQALKDVFDRGNRERQKCAIGSAKANLGHLDAAAGVTGLIKAALVVQRGQIPPMCNFAQNSASFGLEGSSFYIPRRLTPWRVPNGRRRAGVSSFGIGGTNVHVVIEEPPPLEIREQKSSKPRVLPLSARTFGALNRLIGDYARFVQHRPETPLEDICFTAANGRERFEHRAAVVAGGVEELYEALFEKSTGGHPENLFTAVETDKTGGEARVGFLFTGQGSQYVGMGAELYREDEVFKETIDECDDFLKAHHDIRLKEVLFGEQSAKAEATLADTRLTQPAVCAVELGLARAFGARGAKPSFVMGHSLGEYVAAWACGVFSWQQMLSLVATRGELMSKLPPIGAMAAVFASEETVLEHIEKCEPGACVSSMNGPKSTVVSGRREAVAQLVERLKAEGVGWATLKVSHAFHSKLMAPMLPEFEKALARVSFSQPKIPLISNATGRVADGAIASPGYWLEHILKPVRFARGMATMADGGCKTFLELGPQPVLSGMALALEDERLSKRARFIPTLVRGKSDSTQVARALAQLYCDGADVRFDEMGWSGSARRASLPVYPFEPVSCWVKGPAPTIAPQTTTDPSALAPQCAAARGSREENCMNDSTRSHENAAAISTALTEEIARITGKDPRSIEPGQSFFALGMDSLMLIRLRQYVEDTHGVELPVSALFDRFDNVDKLGLHVSKSRPRKAEALQAPPAAPLRAAAQAPTTSHQAPPGSLEELALHQVTALSTFMERQLAILADAASPQGKADTSSAPADEPTPERRASKERPKHITMFQNLGAETFTQTQQAFLNDLIERFNAKTPKSKAWIAGHRPRFSDWINAVNFRLAIKELQYPIVAEASSGAHLTDLDGNEYLDLAMGYGVCFLGHKFEPVRKAMEEQLGKGYQLGPQFSVTGEVVDLICEMTGVERVVFTNTGCEAMMFAVRVARAMTRRDKIAIFSGSYHGMFDGVLASQGEHGTEPAVPGTPASMVEDVVMLNYGDEESLNKLEKMGHELAAILVEPVQSRRPGYQPREFLHSLRKIADRCGAALVFDEIITGFRIRPGGAQEYFDVRADIVAYGKVIGGGMPVGIVAGKAEFMDAIDGGAWSYGDDSVPKAEPTAFAGTFCKHPLTMVAMRAALSYLKEKGPALQREVNERTERIVSPLNTFFEEQDVPIRIRHFGSVFRFESFGKYDLANNPIEMELLFHLLMEKGVYTWERHICFLSIAHTDEDAERVVKLTKQSIFELRAGGFTFSSRD